MSYSVPTSPTVARSTSRKSYPVTPQRLPAPRQHRYSSSQSYYRSPVTPASPYTPLSLRSFSSSVSGSSSTLTTPDNIGTGKNNNLFSPEVSRPTTVTPGKDQSLADIAQNWRSRASENGIKVSSVKEDSQHADDEASERTIPDANHSGFISTEEALLPPPFLSNQRRTTVSAMTTRPRSQSHAPMPTSRAFSSPTILRNRTTRATGPPTSPLIARRLGQSQNHLMATPPPNRVLARQLKFKGSFTDPPQPRRREAFGTIRTPSQNVNSSLNLSLNQDASLDLFDIDENDFESEYDCSCENILDQDYRGDNNPLYDPHISSDNSNTYQHSNYSLPSFSPQYFTSHTQNVFADPFQGQSLSSIAESVEHHFQQHGAAIASNVYMGLRQDITRAPPTSLLDPSFGLGPGSRGYTGGPAWVPVPASAPILPPISVHASSNKKALDGAKPETKQPGCSVCLASHPRTLAVLIPCKHPLCSACLTSALNIVGEKDMECAVCRGKVQDFKLVPGDGRKKDNEQLSDTNKKEKRENKSNDMSWSGESFMEPLFSSLETGSCADGLDSAFEFGLGLNDVRASTPKLRDEPAKQAPDEPFLQSSERKVLKRDSRKPEDNVVLRIDNVPWDITPPQIKQWLQQPVERVHVLLDAKGKTMSHAYVEVGDAVVAGRILRGEGGGFEEYANEERKDGGRKLINRRERGSVLGKGRRARGVTVTRTGQEELMSDLFPNWKGTFDGSRPSLAGLDGERIIGALEGGLITEGEITGLLHLIREPDSHFLKVPSLPFHSLISILSKFPTDVDSRVFWSAGVRDMLYGESDFSYLRMPTDWPGTWLDVTYAAVQVLRTRIDRGKGPSGPANVNDQYPMDLVCDIIETAMICQAFTTQQISKFAVLLESLSLAPCPISTSASRSRSSSRSGYSQPKTPDNQGLCEVVPAALNGEESLQQSNHGSEHDVGALADIAREFGVEAHLVQALAQRLVGLC